MPLSLGRAIGEPDHDRLVVGEAGVLVIDQACDAWRNVLGDEDVIGAMRRPVRLVRDAERVRTRRASGDERPNIPETRHFGAASLSRLAAADVAAVEVGSAMKQGSSAIATVAEAPGMGSSGAIDVVTAQESSGCSIARWEAQACRFRL